MTKEDKKKNTEGAGLDPECWNETPVGEEQRVIEQDVSFVHDEII